MKVFLQCCDCGDVKAIEGCIPEVILQENRGEHLYIADDCGGMRRKQLDALFGQADVEEVALMLYKLFHNEVGECEPGWTPYKKYSDDYVVQKFREMAIMVQRMHESMKFGGS